MNDNKYIPNSAKAFTLIELLFVIATVSLLSALIIPTLARAKIKTPEAGCLSNMRQIMMGWSLYKEENGDVLLPNSPGGTSTNLGWISGNAQNWSSSDANTNAVLLASGLLGPYIAKDIRIFKCPADVVPSANGQRLRSVSMNSQMGSVFYAPSMGLPDSPALVFSKGSDITCPLPANAFVFADENPGSINDGRLVIDSHNGTFPDVPAAYHGGAGGLSFADGHGEVHRWITSTLTGPTCQVKTGLTISQIVASGGKINIDWLWFSQHAACDSR